MKTEQEIREDIKNLEKGIVNDVQNGLYLLAFAKKVQIKALKSVIEEKADTANVG